jgi:hypothetical protein
VINEIMYNPASGGVEYVELHNITTGDVDITDWDIDGTGVRFPAGTVVAAGGFFLLVDTNNIVVADFRITNGVDVSVPVLGSLFVLENDGEALRLEKSNDTPLAPDILVDRVRYNDRSPWPTEADGEGPALERFVPELYGNDPINWRTVDSGGSPGRVNLFNAGIAIVKGTAWKYHASGANLGTHWQSGDYSDSSWPEGDGFLGYGSPMINTVLSFGVDPTNKHESAYFRKEFVVNDAPTSITDLTLQAWYDDGVVAYLNGTEVFRSPSMPDGAIAYNALTETNYNSFGYESIDLTSAVGLLRQGANVLAVEVHQVSRASEDLVWDAALGYNTDSVPVLAPPTASPSGGSFTDPIAVILSALPPTSEIYYTQDGTEPDQAATLYTHPIRLTAATVIRARAFEPGYNESPVATFTFAHASRSVSFALAVDYGSETVTAALIEVVVSPLATNEVGVDYGLAAGATAAEGDDFTLPGGTLVFAAGQTSSNLLLTIINDTNSEPDELIMISLSNAVNAVIGEKADITYTILDNDRDSDSDGIPDIIDLDDDNDGMPDHWEVRQGLDPLLNDASGDWDGDGWNNLEEYQNGTDPRVYDSGAPVGTLFYGK